MFRESGDHVIETSPGIQMSNHHVMGTALGIILFSERGGNVRETTLEIPTVSNIVNNVSEPRMEF